jgi:hypothetical protein
MDWVRMIGGSSAAAAALVMALPVQAQHRGGDHRPRHEHRDRVDAGGLVLGALFVGGVIALANGEKKRRERLATYMEDYEAPPEGEPVPPGMSPVADIPAPYADEYDGLYDPEAAQERCAAAAETEAKAFARLARVTSVSGYTWNGKSWVVKGRLELADGYADTARSTFKFRCALRAGREPVISIAGLTPAG